MTLSPESTVADIATAAPATIAVFQQHHIDFCCGGRVALAQACRVRGLDLNAVLTDLRAAVTPAAADVNWNEASLTSLVDHIQHRYHEPLRRELPRLAMMLRKVAMRHADRLPDVLPALQRTFEALQAELLDHMLKEDRMLFPIVVSLESGPPLPALSGSIGSPIAVLEAEHEHAGAALAVIRDVTNGFAPPEWACPTFRGLYYGLAQLETDMHVHVHLENNVLFPRALQLARRAGV